MFDLILSFLINRLLGVALDGKSLQEYPANAGIPQGSILGPTLLSVILLSMLMILLSTLSVIRHLNFGNN